MSDTQAMILLFDYREWANHRFLDAAAPLARQDYERDLKGSHGGIHGTLVHTYGAEYLWHQRFGGVSPSSQLWPLVQHVTNHGSYHRSQVAVFLRQLGVTPPATDLVAFDRERR